MNRYQASRDPLHDRVDYSSGEDRRDPIRLTPLQLTVKIYSVVLMALGLILIGSSVYGIICLALSAGN